MGGGTSIACLIGAVTAWALGVHNGPTAIGIVVGMFGLMLQVLFGLLMLAAVAPTSMAEERQRGTLDVLAATTLRWRVRSHAAASGSHRNGCRNRPVSAGPGASIDDLRPSPSRRRAIEAIGPAPETA